MNWRKYDAVDLVFIALKISVPFVFVALVAWALNPLRN